MDSTEAPVFLKVACDFVLDVSTLTYPLVELSEVALGALCDILDVGYLDDANKLPMCDSGVRSPIRMKPDSRPCGRLMGKELPSMLSKEKLVERRGRWACVKGLPTTWLRACRADPCVPGPHHAP